MFSLALRDIATDWGSLYANHAAVRTTVVFAHVGGLLINGAVLTSAERRAALGAGDAWRTLQRTAVFSLVLWLLTTLAGVTLLNS